MNPFDPSTRLRASPFGKLRASPFGKLRASPFGKLRASPFGKLRASPFGKLRASQFEILEHRADFKIRAFGKTKEELFLNALLGMITGLRPEIRNSKSEIRNIKVKSPDLEALLVDFLSEVLYLIQTNKEIYNDVKFKKFSDTKLEAELTGQKVERFGEDIKAVTHHGLKIDKKDSGLLEAVVLFDI